MERIKGEPCPVCNKQRYYKTKQGAIKSKTVNCRSCSNSISMGGDGIEYNNGGERMCCKCKVKPSKWNSYCQECSVEHRKDYYSEVYKFKRYNIDKQVYDKTFKAQGGKCYACGSTDELCIDHDHNTGKFRGILCRPCNASLGLLRDDKEILRKLIKYLNEANKNNERHCDSHEIC